MAGQFKLGRRGRSFLEKLAEEALAGYQTFTGVQERQEGKRVEGEERTRREEERQLRMAGLIANLASTPGVSIEGAAGGVDEEMLVPPSGAPERFAGRELTGAAARALAPTAPEIEPTMPGPPIPGGERPVPSVAGAISAGPGAAGAGAPAAPSSLLELANLTLGDRDLRIQFDPEARGRARAAEEATEAERQQAAFDALHRADPDAYPDHIEGFDYVNEVDEFAADVRAGRRAPSPGASGDATRLALERRRRQAETITARLALQPGLDEDQIVAYVTGDADVGDAISGRDVLKIVREARGATEPTDESRDERRRSLVQELGRPTNELQQEIIDALADGETPDEILEALADVNAGDETIAAARRYMRKLTTRGGEFAAGVGG